MGECKGGSNERDPERGGDRTEVANPIDDLTANPNVPKGASYEDMRKNFIEQVRSLKPGGLKTILFYLHI